MLLLALMMESCTDEVVHRKRFCCRHAASLSHCNLRRARVVHLCGSKLIARFARQSVCLVLKMTDKRQSKERCVDAFLAQKGIRRAILKIKD